LIILNVIFVTAY